MTKFGSANADKAYEILQDGKEHISHQFNQLVGWDWRKAVSLVKKYGERTGEFEVRSAPEKVGATIVKRYWLVRKKSGIVSELAELKKPVVPAPPAVPISDKQRKLF